MLQKVFRALISSDMNVNLRSFFPFEVSCTERHARNTSFSFTGVQKISLNDSLGLELFVFFSSHIEDLFTKRLCFGLPFPHRNLN